MTGAAINPSGVGAMSKGRLLVVEDDARLRKYIHLILTQADYDVVEAQDGEQAIEAIRSDDNPLLLDAIICDLVMPKVSGMEAIAYFRSQFPAVPILVLTGHATVENISELYQQGVVDYLVKPIGPERLLPAVESAVKMPRSSP